MVETRWPALVRFGYVLTGDAGTPRTSCSTPGALLAAVAPSRGRLPGALRQGGDGEPGDVTDRVGLLGPASAVTAELRNADGDVVATAPLTGGGAAVDAPGAVAVRFLDATGAEVARADVAPWDHSGDARPLWDR